MKSADHLNLDQAETKTRGVCAEILERIGSRRPGDFEERAGSDPLRRWSAEGPLFLAGVCRFVDVFPSLQDDAEIIRHLEMCVGSPERFLGTKSAPKTPADAVRREVQSLARRFTAGGSIEEALKHCRELRKKRVASTLDVLGESVVSEKEADAYLDACLSLLGQACKMFGSWKTCSQVDDAPFGKVPRTNLSVKLSSLYCRFDPIDQRGAVEGVVPRFRALLRAVRDQGASVNVDMEHYACKDLTIGVFKSVLMEEEFRDWPSPSITIQTYLPENREDLGNLVDWASRRGTPIGLRLVKGAYWDHEVLHARYQKWPEPVYLDKQRTDADFEEACRFALARPDCFRTAVASHNVRSVSHAMVVARELGLPEGTIEFQTLCGFGEELRDEIAEMGYRVRVYAPYGALVPGMTYLVRRLLEATSRSSFLRQMWRTPLPVEELARAPEVRPAGKPKPETKRIDPLEMPFENEPLTDFRRAEARDRMARSLRDVRSQLGQEYPLWLAGKSTGAKEEIVSRNPGRVIEVVGRVACASLRKGATAVRAASEAFADWSRSPVRDRANLLLRTADVLRSRRFELAAWEVLEVGKSWREADADVAEAIDYLEYYAREAVRLAGPARHDAPGERNTYFYEPRGVTVAITPWNFPLGILTGVTSAACVTGNTVIMKPAEQSSVVAAKLMDAWREAGVPTGVIQYVPGRGEGVGEYLVRHPDVNVVGFTGSVASGLRIQNLTARVSSRHGHIKRVIAEMGGKNAIVIDRTADLDDAVRGVVRSAFDFQGQKCSACSRAVVLREVCDAFIERLVEAARSLPVGPPWDPHFALGPLIDEEAVRRVDGYVNGARGAARIYLETNVGHLAREGHYVGPVIFADVDPGLPIAQEEVFGPVLCVLRADNLDEAIALANGTAYGLTGGLYSRDPESIRRVQAELEVGNVYVNRKITGALVDRQPFGGRRLSGIGSKTGGPDYLLQFMQPKTLTEWTVRHGFAPPEE